MRASSQGLKAHWTEVERSITHALGNNRPSFHQFVSKMRSRTTPCVVPSQGNDGQIGRFARSSQCTCRAAVHARTMPSPVLMLEVIV